MKNIFKKLLKYIGIFLLILIFLIGLLFGYGYYKKIKRDLINYHIQEKLVVKFEDDDNKYLVNLNDGSYVKYDGYYTKYKHNFEDYDNINKEQIYNKNNEYYFYYKPGEYYRSLIYNKNNDIYYKFTHDFNSAYWSQDGNYLITKKWYVIRMFGLFLAKEIGPQVITIFEPTTLKNKQLLINDEDGKMLRIERILGYVLE